MDVLTHCPGGSGTSMLQGTVTTLITAMTGGNKSAAGGGGGGERQLTRRGPRPAYRLALAAASCLVAGHSN